MLVAVKKKVGETCAPNLICPLVLWRLVVLFAKSKKAHPLNILTVFLSSHSKQERTHVMFLEMWLSRILKAVCGASVGIVEDAASWDVTGG